MTPDPLDPALFEPPDMRAAPAGQDISTVYGLLKAAGLTQTADRAPHRAVTGKTVTP